MGSGKESKGADSTSSGSTGNKPFAVGDAVVTTADPVSGKGKPTQESGVIVDDFGENIAVDDAAYGRDWALAKRWAIKLDDGRLVFRRSDEVSRPKT